MNEFILSGANMTILGATTLLAFRPPANGRGIEVSEVRVSQAGTGTAQQLLVALQLIASTFPTMVAQAPVACDRTAGVPASLLTGGDLSTAGQAGKNASAEGAGATTDLVVEGFNNLSGWLWLPTSDSQRIYVPAGASVAFRVKLLTAPSQLTGWCATLRFRER